MEMTIHYGYNALTPIPQAVNTGAGSKALSANMTGNANTAIGPVH
jgi:hypothetical protein